MHRSFLFLGLSCLIITASAQKKGTELDQIKSEITIPLVKSHLTFLAADEMRGRDTGSPEIEIAANYLASYFEQAGLRPISETGDYFQTVNMSTLSAPSSIDFKFSNHSYKENSDLVLLNGGDVDVQADIVFVGHGTQEDFDKTDVKDKIVVVLAGYAGEANASKALMSDAPEKELRARQKGALLIIELFTLPGVPFQALVNYLSTERYALRDGNPITHLWLRAGVEEVGALKAPGLKGTVKVSGVVNKSVHGRNVVGILEGSDPVLKKEYLAVTAHYDHVGVGEPDAAGDSIFNGARDNAIGTVGLLATAGYLTKYRPKRSVLFVALVAEEKGLLGSAWYVRYPLVPLNQTVFNFNCDGAGYNDTTLVTVIGLERTSAAPTIEASCSAFGLQAKPDPAPEQNLYERSDNYNFAMMGVPAIDFAPGVRAFDEALFKYYHQRADEVNSLDFNYLIKFFRAFVHANAMLANAKSAIQWTPGDTFESIGKQLYRK